MIKMKVVTFAFIFFHRGRVCYKENKEDDIMGLFRNPFKRNQEEKKEEMTVEETDLMNQINYFDLELETNIIKIFEK